MGERKHKDKESVGRDKEGKETGRKREREMSVQI